MINFVTNLQIDKEAVFLDQMQFGLNLYVILATFDTIVYRECMPLGAIAYIKKKIGPSRVYGLKLLLILSVINLPGTLLSGVSFESFLLKVANASEVTVNSGGDVGDYINLGLLLLLLLFWVLGWKKILRIYAMLYAAVVTVRLLFNVLGMVTILLYGNAIVKDLHIPVETSGIVLFKDGVLLWISNVLLYSAWYWLLDGGGSLARRNAEGRPDFAFPQQSGSFPGWEGWYPRYMDYLFLAFNTSTAVSPTDTVVLSHRAKILMMIQSGTSLIVLAVLAARAINLLQ